MDYPPIRFRAVTTAVSGVVAASAAAGAVLSLLNTPKPAWFLFLFEPVVLTAGVLGVLIGLGRSRAGPAIGLACVAVTILLASYLGYRGAERSLMDVSLRHALEARAFAAAVLGAAAGWTVLSRRPGVSLPLAVKGLATGVPALAIVGGAWAFRAQAAAMPGPAKVGAAGLGLVAFVALASASVHLLIAAFEAGRAPGEMTKAGTAGA